MPGPGLSGASKGELQQQVESSTPEPVHGAGQTVSHPGWVGLQRYAGNRAFTQLLQSGAGDSEGTGHGIRSKGGNGSIHQRTLTDASLAIQTKPAPGQSADQAEDQAGRAPETGTTAPASSGQQTPSTGLIVDDGVRQIGPGQMKKALFLSQLRTAVCSVAEEALTGTMWSAMGCPYIDQWLSFYSKQDSRHIERALRKFAPETASATTAQEYIPIVAERVRRRVVEWGATGKVEGLPSEVTAGVPSAAGNVGAMAGLVAGVGSAASGAVYGIGQVLTGMGRMLFKGREGGTPASGNSQDVLAQLGPGHSLDQDVKSRTSASLGADFSGVRIHTDSRAAELSDGLNARAFTIGTDIAFGQGEYQPGTLIGDALIAHELAHVVQQRGASSTSTTRQSSSSASDFLEQDADRSAMIAILSLWGKAKSRSMEVAHDAVPRLKSGLRLQRCAGPSAQRQQTRPVACPEVPADQWRTAVEAAQAMSDGAQKRDAMVVLVRQALCPLNIDVQTAGETSPNQVAPSDYKEAPALNFDVNLATKRRWPGAQGGGTSSQGQTRPVGNQPGYFFSHGSKSYAVIGPLALSPRSPLFTRQSAEHELYHTVHHTRATTRRGAEASPEQELETWVHDFRSYFHQYISLPFPQRPAWEPLIGYYEDPVTGEAARQAALVQLSDYYNHPPSGVDAGRVQHAFRVWVHNRDISRRLVRDLEDRLHIERSSRTRNGP